MGVVVPFANEEDTARRFLLQVLAHLEECDKVFCVFDKSCTDNTGNIVKALARTHPSIRFIWAPENTCVVDAYFRGYRAAIAARCRYILEMDAGFSHDPRQIQRFRQAIENGAEYVGGSRFIQGGSHRGNFIRWIISKGGTVLSNLLLGTRMSDMCSGFQCFTYAALNDVVEAGVTSRGHFFQTEIRTRMHNWNWAEVPITYQNPSKSIGKDALLESIKHLWMLRKELRRMPTKRMDIGNNGSSQSERGAA